MSHAWLRLWAERTVDAAVHGARDAWAPVTVPIAAVAPATLASAGWFRPGTAQRTTLPRSTDRVQLCIVRDTSPNRVGANPLDLCVRAISRAGEAGESAEVFLVMTSPATATEALHAAAMAKGAIQAMRGVVQRAFWA
jgi:hypothetical protein